MVTEVLSPPAGSTELCLRPAVTALRGTTSSCKRQTAVISACYWGGNAEKGADDQYMDATVEATKVNDGESWQSAIDGMNAALSGNDYEWALGTDGLPVLKKK